eukprot:1424905-Lingulodinium_polyedra.AAC.1
MTRSSRPSAAVTARELHARARHARARKLACAWSARARGLRAAAATYGRFDRIIARGFKNRAQ